MSNRVESTSLLSLNTILTGVCTAGILWLCNTVWEMSKTNSATAVRLDAQGAILNSHETRLTAVERSIISLQVQGYVARGGEPDALHH